MGFSLQCKERQNKKRAEHFTWPFCIGGKESETIPLSGKMYISNTFRTNLVGNFILPGRIILKLWEHSQVKILKISSENFNLSLKNSVEISNSVITTFNALHIQYIGIEASSWLATASQPPLVLTSQHSSASVLQWGRCSEGHFRNQSTIFFLVCFGKDMSAILQ